MIVEVTRGDVVESVHRVAACAVDGRGNVLLEDGDVGAAVFLRSAAKPFIAAAALEAGVRERFGLDSREIAVMAASHFGEPFHVAAVTSILKKIGLDESALQCGTHLPYDQTTADEIVRSGRALSPLYNNCSGKHAGILALCLTIGADIETYLDLHNPVQQRILTFCARISDEDPAAWPIGVDGCGIPVYATGLRKAALSFARLATFQGVTARDAAALEMVRDAMVAHPEYVAGTGQLDTVLMQSFPGEIACKGGAEGVHGVAAIAAGFGYAAKVLDGAGRARGPSTIAALRPLGAIGAAIPTNLDRFAHPLVYNRAGSAVGEIRTTAVAEVVR